MLKIFCDGGSRSNPGNAASAFFVYDENGEELISRGKFLGQATNNFAEYTGVLMAFEWLLENKKNDEEINFYLDSQLVVNQLNGVYRIKEKTLINLAMEIKKLEKNFLKKVSFQYIPRNENKKADALVNEVLDKHVN